MTWFLITQYVQVEVECDVVPDYSEMYQYRQDEWVKLNNFDFYSSVPGRFIGEVLVVTMVTVVLLEVECLRFVLFWETGDLTKDINL